MKKYNVYTSIDGFKPGNLIGSFSLLITKDQHTVNNLFYNIITNYTDKVLHKWGANSFMDAENIYIMLVDK